MMLADGTRYAAGCGSSSNGSLDRCLGGNGCRELQSSAHLPIPFQDYSMSLAALVLVSAQLAAADPALPAGMQLVYRGSLVPVKDDGIPTKKEFELTLVVSDAAADGQPAAGACTLLWTLAESGRGSWLWLDHFGAWEVSALARDDGQTGPALLYVREQGTSVIPLPGLLFAREGKISGGASWSEGRL